MWINRTFRCALLPVFLTAVAGCASVPPAENEALALATVPTPEMTDPGPICTDVPDFRIPQTEPSPVPAAAEQEPLPALRGKASYYGKRHFQGRRTASGERFDAEKFTSASNRFPLRKWLAVRRLEKSGAPTGECVLVWNNDRMHTRHEKRIIDLSFTAGQAIRMIHAGVVDVEVRQLDAAPPDTTLDTCRAAFVAPETVNE